MKDQRSSEEQPGGQRGAGRQPLSPGKRTRVQARYGGMTTQRRGGEATRAKDGFNVAETFNGPTAVAASEVVSTPTSPRPAVVNEAKQHGKDASADTAERESGSAAVGAIAGAVVGGTIGAFVGGPTGALVGAGIGAGVGALLGAFAGAGSDHQSKQNQPPVGPSYSGAAVTPTFVLDKKIASRSNTKSSTQSASNPTFVGEAAVDTSKKAWRYQLTSVKSKGKIRIVYFTKSHYPAPTPTDDSGALSNVTSRNWKDIVKDLEANKAGVPDFWSAYRAEDVHEDYHWQVEWQGEIKKELAKAEAQIAALELGFDKADSQTAAEAVLAPKAKKSASSAKSVGSRGLG